MSVAVAARLLGGSRATVKDWRQAGVVLTPAPATRRHEVTVDSVARLQALADELRRLGKTRQLCDYGWWAAQDAADYADSQASRVSGVTIE